MLNGSAYCRMIYSEGRAVDFVHEKVNSQFEVLTGLKNLAGRKASEVIPGILESNPEFIERFGGVATTGIADRYEMYIQPLNMWLDIMAFSPKKGYFIALFDVITERKRAEQALTESNERLQLIMQATHAGIWEWDLRTNENIWSNELWRLYGLKPHCCKASFEIWLQTVIPEDRQKTIDAVNNAVQKGIEFNHMWRTRDVNGNVRWLMSKGTPFRDENDQLCRYVGIVVDITERKDAADAILESESRFQELADLLPQPVFECDLQGKITYINRLGLESFGYTPQEVQNGIPSFVFFAPEEQERIRQSMEYRLKNIPFENHEYTCIKKDGTTLPVMLYTSRIMRENQPIGIRGIALDITARKQSEQKIQELNQTLEERIEEKTRELAVTHQQLILQEKRASIGQLTAGIAHELNNPLNYIRINFATQRANFTDLLLIFNEYRTLISIVEKQGSVAETELQKLHQMEKELTLDILLADIPQIFTESQHGFKRILTITNSMRNFSYRHAIDEKVPFDINKGIRDTLTLSRNEYRDYAEIETRLEELPQLLCNPEQICQVFLNLIVNSAHAIVSQQRSSCGKITIHTWADQHQVYCSIADDGPGIPEEIRNNIFNPFFTTKQPGKGTGLGLSISYDIIVQKHGGLLEVECPAEGGTVFTLSLPLNVNKS